MWHGKTQGKTKSPWLVVGCINRQQERDLEELFFFSFYFCSFLLLHCFALPASSPPSLQPAERQRERRVVSRGGGRETPTRVIQPARLVGVFRLLLLLLLFLLCCSIGCCWPQLRPPPPAAVSSLEPAAGGGGFYSEQRRASMAATARSC